MKHRIAIYVGYILPFVLCGFLSVVNAAPGDLDTSFSLDGKIVDTLLVKGNAQGRATAVQADGKIVVAGILVIGNNGGTIPQRFGCAIARYNPNGSFDTTFDEDGRIVGQIGTGFRCTALAIQSDGKIVVGGGTASSGNSDFAVMRFNPNGSPDTTFGSGGYVTNGIETSGSYDTITALAIQTDGKIVASGVTNATGNSNFAAARYNPNGTLDTTFDGDGKVFTDFSSSIDYGYGLTIQADGKIIVAGESYVNSYPDFALVRYNANGSLDTTFDGDGKLTKNLSTVTAGGNSDDHAYTVTTQTDGKIVVAGSAIITANQVTRGTFVVLRLNNDGSSDNSFGSGGIFSDVNINQSGGNAYILSLALQTDGRIIAVGYSYDGFTLIRLNENGSLDTTFDVDGIVKTSISLYNDYAYSVALQTDGKIVAAGFSGINSVNIFAIVRYNTDGSLDTSFDDDGIRTSEMGYPTSSSATKAAIQADGKIVAVGYSFNGANDDFALVRYNVDGSRDSAFGGGEGSVTTDINGLIDGDRAFAVAIQSDGKIVAGGDTANYGERSDFALIRYNADGSRDNTFGIGGIVTTGFSTNSYDFVRALVVQPDGKIIAAGASSSNSNGFDFALIRYNSNGSLDTSFGIGGKVTTPISTTSEEVRSLILQTDGKIVAAGYTSTNVTSNDIAIVRYNADGSLDTSFDGDGIVTTDISGTNNSATAVTLQTDGKIIAAGVNYNGSNTDFALVRYNPNGSLDTSFDVDGKVTTNITVTESATGVAVQTDGKIIAGGSTYPGSVGNDGAIVRYNSDGSLDTSFGAGGKRIFDMFPGSNDFFYGLTLDSSGRAVMVGETNPANDTTKRIAVARILTASAPHITPFDFDGDGKSDLSIFRPSNGQWWYSRSSDGGNRTFAFGNSADKLVPGDYTGDGKTDVAIFRPSSGEWFILRSENASFYSFPFGTSDDIPVPSDFDGDGKTDAAVFRPSNSTWYINKSSGGILLQQFGQAGDVPAVGDYDGDGKTDLAIFRPSNGQWWIQRSSNSSVYAFNFGNATDKLVPGDYTGDGKTDAAFWRPSTGEWFIYRSETLSYYSVPFGTSGDIPTPADYDGDGKTDTAVFRPTNSNWYVQRSTAGILIQQFGISGDKPVPNAFVP
ncbi:hypothetical protein BH10ACI1_BH10ACI1_03860 [soil metagenome]